MFTQRYKPKSFNPSSSISPLIHHHHSSFSLSHGITAGAWMGFPPWRRAYKSCFNPEIIPCNPCRACGARFITPSQWSAPVNPLRFREGSDWKQNKWEVSDNAWRSWPAVKVYGVKGVGFELEEKGEDARGKHWPSNGTKGPISQ